LLVLASIALITLDYRGGAHGAISWAKRTSRDAFTPVQHGVDGLVRPVASFLSGAVHAGDLQNQNAKLRAEIGRIQRQSLALRSTQNTIRTLEQLDKLPWVGALPTVTAQVTALSPSNFVATIQLNKGTTSGIAVGMPVVGGAGLVGQVIEVWSTGSVVRLITDERSAVGVRFGPDGELALVQGSGLGKDLDVNLITPGTSLHRGEVLTTSGLQNAQYPPNIPVALVTSFSSTPSATQESVSAEPSADLALLQYVDVLQWQPPP
jgi:rod shape-determining protein MreC